MEHYWLLVYINNPLIRPAISRGKRWHWGCLFLGALFCQGYEATPLLEAAESGTLKVGGFATKFSRQALETFTCKRFFMSTT